MKSIIDSMIRGARFGILFSAFKKPRFLLSFQLLKKVTILVFKCEIYLFQYVIQCNYQSNKHIKYN